ncbi:hypothetical protein QBC39DRAFT_40540 [Podospora conica]|nr:hypothetical protein QBC39DRAFT_40540 [Schizothecium conicum]
MMSSRSLQSFLRPTRCKAWICHGARTQGLEVIPSPRPPCPSGILPSSHPHPHPHPACPPPRCANQPRSRNIPTPSGGRFDPTHSWLEGQAKNRRSGKSVKPCSPPNWLTYRRCLWPRPPWTPGVPPVSSIHKTLSTTCSQRLPPPRVRGDSLANLGLPDSRHEATLYTGACLPSAAAILVDRYASGHDGACMVDNTRHRGDTENMSFLQLGKASVAKGSTSAWQGDTLLTVRSLGLSGRAT